MHFKVHVKEAGFVGSLHSLFHRKYRQIVAVDDISFDIPAGEIIGFLGPNGAGKTTILKMMSGLLHPTSGTVSVDGHTPHQRDAAFLHRITLVMGQKQQLLWDLPASDSFLVNQAYYDIPDADYRKRLGELIELLALQRVIDKPMRTLSLGERMKCELAAALLHQPKILFLDEPTIGLDITMQQNVRDFIRDYNRLHNATVVLTSHYMGDIAALVSRVIVIDNGQLAFDGTLRDLTQRVADRKILKLHFTSLVARTALERFGVVERLDGHMATIRVERGAVPQIAGAILAEYPVEDIAIEDIPIEDVVSSLFAGSKSAVGTG
jgi:ABC-2 type transport system ATP-binding protein